MSSTANANVSVPDWNEFFKLRRRKAWFQRVAAIPFVFGFLTAEGSFLSMPIFDPTQPIFGIDPFIFIGVGTMVGSAASYFMGAAFMGFLWRQFRSARAFQLDQVSLYHYLALMMTETEGFLS